MSQVADYEVGWICAILVEYVAACELLDERYSHAPSGLSPHDGNAYSFGRMGAHHVVIACLPLGKYGTTSATAVAINMFRSFPSIRSYMMVGIGGGAPSDKHDIRLGDIVVSVPDRGRRENGVVCYQHGTTIQERPFQRTGSLNAPPLTLLSAVQDLGLLHKQRGHRIHETVATVIARCPNLGKQYAKPESEDILYQSNFVHSDNCRTCQEICGQSQDKIVDRTQQRTERSGPLVHYGLIASSDKLMKDALVRDTLAREEGILCIEMEAAGLMDWIPCIVIRGICDYADTHKNDVWHGYAALCAAAYTKELLQVLRGNESMPLVSGRDANGLEDNALSIETFVNPSGPGAVGPTQPKLEHSIFDQLTANPIYVVHDEPVMWRKLTILSWALYEEIYQSMDPKDPDGYVSISSFQEKIPEGPIRKLVSEYWTLFKGATVTRPLPKGYAMALLYMLHMTKVTEYRWTSIAGARLYTLRRFADWVPCSCDPHCGLKWNFANDFGLSVPMLLGHDHRQCLAVKYQKSTKLEKMINMDARKGRLIDQTNRANWKQQGKSTRNQCCSAALQLECKSRAGRARCKYNTHLQMDWESWSE